MVTVLLYSELPRPDLKGGRANQGAEARASGLQGATNLHILAHAWPLSSPKFGAQISELDVLVAGSRRMLPEAKHSSWLRDRRPLDKLKAQVWIRAAFTDCLEGCSFPRCCSLSR